MSEDRQAGSAGASMSFKARALSAGFAVRFAFAVCAAASTAVAVAETRAGAESFSALMEPISDADVVLSEPAPEELPEDVIARLFKPQVANSKARSQCVPFARAESGIDIRGDAKTWWVQAAGRYQRDKEPAEGAVIVMRGYGGADRGHVGVVRKVLGERKILIDHANWLNQGEITVRVPVVDVSAKGDWSEVRVWHVPGKHWGKRIYGAQGFILPKAVHAGGQTNPEPVAIAAAF
jgi:hypothetical protein